MNYNHLVLDIKLENLIEIKQVDKVCKNITNILDLTILKEKNHIFDDWWFTIFFLLAESHISAHYRIEDNYLALDIYSCRNIKYYETQTIEIINTLWVKNIKLTKLWRNFIKEWI